MTESSFATPRVRTSNFRLGRVITRSASVLWGHLIRFFVVGLLASLPTLLLVKSSGVGPAVAVGPAVGPAVPALLGRLLWEMLAFNAVLLVVTYHDLRVAKEGTDIERLAVVFD